MSIQNPAANLSLSLTPLKAALRSSGAGDLDVLLRVQANDSAPVNRTPLSLALVIDRSGSMSGASLKAAKDCARHLVMSLHEADEVSLVTFDDEVAVPLPLVSGVLAKTLIDAALASFGAGGSTALHAGWLAGAQQLASRTSPGRVCRVILLSDGQANHGITDEGTICDQVRLLAQSGVTTTTVGLGLHFQEGLMSAMATAGQGNALYGESVEDLAEPFESELGLLSALAWRDVRLVVGSATSRWRLRNDYLRGADGSWALPSIPAGSEAWAVFSVSMDSALRAQARSRQGKALHVTVHARDTEGRDLQFTASLDALPLIDEGAWAALPQDELVARRLGELRAAELSRDVRDAVRSREWGRAESLLQQVEALAEANPWLQSMLAELRRLLAQRDEVRMSKELVYAARSMSMRVAAVDEGAAFALSDEADMPAFLRRKAAQGRRSS